MRKKMEMQWEMIDESPTGNMQTLRAKVIGGWIVKTIVSETKLKLLGCSSVFIPDRDHEWTIVAPLSVVEAKPTVKAEDFAPKK